MYIFLQQQAGINKDRQQGVYIQLINEKNEIVKDRIAEKKKFTDNIAVIREKLFQSIDIAKKDWFESEDFKKTAFDVMKKFPNFKENLRLNFFEQHNVSSQKPEVNVWDLIKSNGFSSILGGYFSKNFEERKTHKLRMVFELTKIDLICHPENFGDHSTAYRYVLGEKAYQNIFIDLRLPIFCSLVEFYGKDFFDKLPKQEKTIVKKFYSNNRFGFKLSDPSILDNDNEILKINNENSNIR